MLSHPPLQLVKNGGSMELKITTSCGRVEGKTQGGVRVWKGIPYAGDYTGERRFRSARPREKWDGVYRAFDFPAAAPQLPKLVGGITEGDPTDEKSLCVNIWAPEETAEKLPVLVWIYGGAFVTGDCGVDIHDGARLVRKEKIILVSINYRINALGFLDFSSVLPGAESNVGLRDQALALKWVYENIGAFGGDSENITVFGQSAGGHSVASLLSVPSAREYISKAVIMSAYPLSVNTKEQAAGYARRFLEILGVPKNEAGRLLTAPAGELVAAAKVLEDETSARCNFEFAFVPVADGDFLPLPPVAAADLPREKAIPILMGGVSDEGSLYALQPVPLFPADEKTIGKFTAQNRQWDSERIRGLYKAYPAKKRSYKLGGDILFGVPSLLFADAYSRHAPTWMYNFSYHPLGLKLKKLYTMHGADIPFAFNNLECSIAKKALKLTPVRTVPNRLKDEFSHTIVRFAATGSADWEPYSEKGRAFRDFGRKTRDGTHWLAPFAEEFVKTDYFKNALNK